MNRNLHDKREDYSKYTFEDNKILSNPIELFNKWYLLAEEDPLIVEPNCMNLATSVENIPQSRIVLLKEYSKDGFIFFTNYNSKKGKAIATNPEVCLSFFWPSLQKQIIVNGKAEKISSEESDDYFYTRPVESQIGAIVSQQSEPIPNRAYLEKRFEDCKNSDKKIVRPEHWGGYLVRPYEFEFWQGRISRLHDRVLYTLEGNEWSWKRLSP